MKHVWVLKAGGELMASAPVRKKILNAIARHHHSHPIVFVHGGGPQIEAELLKNKIPTKFVGGRRVTSPAAMTLVERILSGEINKGLAAELGTRGIPSVGLSGRDGKILIGKTIAQRSRTARPQAVNVVLIKALLEKGFVPVISSVASDSRGRPVNINADDAASAIAIKIKARNLIFLTNISGVRDQNKKRIPILKINSIDGLIRKGVIRGGMIPKVQSARAAIQKGVGEVDIINGKDGVHLDEGTRIKK